MTIYNSTKKLTIAVFNPNTTAALNLKTIRFTITAFGNMSNFSGADIKGLVTIASSYFSERALKKRSNQVEIKLEEIEADETDKIGMQDFAKAFIELEKNKAVGSTTVLSDQ